MINRKNAVVSGAAVLALVVLGFRLADKAPEPLADLAPGAQMMQVAVPVLDGVAATGARSFAAKCAVCHGENAAGTAGKAPPLIHKVYQPSHHGDYAFYLAAQNGVRAHHWRFGNMPPLKNVTRAEVTAIIAYVRALQQANGIF